jgi:hypothetical protein
MYRAKWMKNVFLFDVIHQKEEEILPAAQVLVLTHQERAAATHQSISKIFLLHFAWPRADKTGCWRVV